MTDFHFNFYQARTHRAQYEFDLAEQFCVKALEQEPNHIGALSLYGDIKAILGHHREARDAFAAAAKLEPKNNVLLLNLASAVKGLGDFDGARELLEKAIANDKTFAPAYYTLAGIVKFEPGDPRIADFEYLKKRVYGNAIYRCVACFALGKIYNDIGEWDLAFENYSEGNLRRRTRFDIAHTKSAFDAITRYFTPERLQDAKRTGNPSKRPVFVVGMPRSGSSLIEELLSRSPDIEGLGEPQDADDIFKAAFQQTVGPDGASNLTTDMDWAQLAGLGDSYLSRVEQIAPDAARLIDKNLLNHAIVGFLKMMFPNSSVIHARRDPIDSCLSCYFQNFTEGHDYAFDLGDIGRQYAAYADIMKHWDAIFGAEIFSAPYERLVEDKNAAITALFSHIDMPAPDDSLLETPANRAIPTASAWQARQPIYKTSVKRWKNYEKHLSPLFEALEQSGFHYDGE